MAQKSSVITYHNNFAIFWELSPLKSPQNTPKNCRKNSTPIFFINVLPIVDKTAKKSILAQKSSVIPLSY
ncbi:MAG: hypothetical protein ABW185_02015, partial [Sedimenticola sp.]